MMRVWFPSERHAVEFAETVCCSTELRVAWMEGAVIQLATIHVERDEAGVALQSIVERRVHASPRRIAAAAEHLVRVCKTHTGTREAAVASALNDLEDALAEGDQEMAQVQQRAVALEAFYQRMLAIGVARKESYNVISAGEATSYGGYGAAPSNERNRATNGRWLNEPMV